MGSNDMEMRRNVGYMTQAFSLYGELTVRQNLELHAQLYHLPPDKIEGRIKELLERYDLEGGRQRQARKLAARHQAAAAACRGGAARARHSHSRRADLGRRSDRARRVLAHADRPLPRRRRHDLSLDPFHERGGALRPHLADARGQGAGGRRAVSDLVKERGSDSLEDTFVGYLADAAGIDRTKKVEAPPPRPRRRARQSRCAQPRRFDLARLWAYARRETVELLRDPIRLAFAYSARSC